MDFQQLFDKLTSHGWLLDTEARLFWDTLRREKLTGNFLEVGSYYGRSAVFLSHLLAPGAKLHCVDPFDNFDSDDPTGELVHGKFLENTKGLPIVLHHMKVEDWTPEPMDMCYLDGDHTFDGTCRQIEIALACKPKLIFIHDYANGGGGVDVKRACEQILGEPHYRADRLGLWKLPIAK